TKGRVAATRIAPPMRLVTPPPRRSVRRPDWPIAIAAPMPCGMRSRPVMTASSPRTSWKYSGSRTMPPNRTAPSANVVTAADEEAADGRAEDGGEDDRHADRGHHARHLVRAGRAHERDLADRHQHAAREALEDACGDERLEVPGEPAERRAEREERKRDDVQT